MSARTKVCVILLGPPAICLINIVILYTLSFLVDLSFSLHWSYINIWPFNSRYIATLRALNFSDGTAAYVSLATANSAAIAYAVFTFVVVWVGVIMPVRNKSAEYTELAHVWKIKWQVFLFIAMLVLFVSLADFEDTSSIFKLSTRRPITISLIILNMGIYFAAFFVGIVVSVFLTHIIVKFRNRMQVNDGR